MKTSTTAASKQIKKVEKFTRSQSKAIRCKTAQKPKAVPKLAMKLSSKKKTPKVVRVKTPVSTQSKEQPKEPVQVKTV